MHPVAKAAEFQVMDALAMVAHELGIAGGPALPCNPFCAILSSAKECFVESAGSGGC